MADPFRTLATTPTADALAKLRAMPVDPVHWVCALLAAYRECPNADALESWRNGVRNEKMTYIGAASEGLSGQLQKQIFVDEAATTQAHVSTRRYFFISYFESGKCIITFGHLPATPGSETLLVRAGAGNISSDYQAHCNAVAEWVDQGETSIVVRDIDTAVALGGFYYRHVLSLKSAALIVASHPLFMIVAGVLALLIYRIF
jgi:hypothetical protein